MDTYVVFWSRTKGSKIRLVVKNSAEVMPNMRSHQKNYEITVATRMEDQLENRFVLRIKSLPPGASCDGYIS